MKSDERKDLEAKLAAVAEDAGRLKADVLALDAAYQTKLSQAAGVEVGKEPEAKHLLAAKQDAVAELARANAKRFDLNAKLAEAPKARAPASSLLTKPEAAKATEPARDAASPKAAPVPGAKSPARRTVRRPLDAGLAQLDPAVPLVLFPIRIETRFFGSVLKVRIYPDEILADGHEPELTAAEREAGERFWRAAGGAGNAQDAWRELVLGSSPQRAAWILRASVPGGATLVGSRATAWTRAVQAWLLPDSWGVRVLRYNRASVGGGDPVRPIEVYESSAPVDRPLALTLAPPPPDADGPDAAEATDRPVFDEDVRWTVDYERARDVGMAVDVNLSGHDLGHGIDRVYVVGVYSDQSPEEGARALARLLDAHHFTRGLALVPQGTPTNNTADRPAGYPPAEDDRASFAVEYKPPPSAPRGDGAALARALGVDPAVFEHVEGWARTEQRNAEDMNRVLWPATLGYFLPQLLHPTLGLEFIEQTRDHFLRYVRGRGPLPAFRVGNVPYGVVPVSSYTRWQTRGESEFDKLVPPRIRAARVRLRERWRLHYERLDMPHVGRFPNDPDRDLLEILGRDASAREVYVRPTLGPEAVANLLRLEGLDAATITRLRDLESVRAARLPAWPGRSAHLLFDVNAGRFTGPLVDARPLSEGSSEVTEATHPRAYLEWIRTATVEALDARWQEAGASPPLLFSLVRHAALLELLRASDECMVDPEGRLDPAVRRARAFELDQELVNIDSEHAPDEGPMARFLRSIPAAGGDDFADRLRLGAQTFAQKLRLDAAVDGSTDPVWRRLVDAVKPYGDALARLRECPTAELERLLTEGLDVSSHRLDAWETSLYTRRLAEMREARPSGCHVGAYGWVENLRPRGAGYRPSDGYVHGPSIDHAAAAAVLLNAHKSRRGAEAERFRVDLSSARVREARGILDAVRGGQTLAAVLGYRVERALHDQRLSRYVEPLRGRFPMPETRPSGAPGGPLEQIAARNVLNGLALHARCAAGSPPLDLISGEHRERVSRIFGELERSVDAVGDLLSAESVFQVVRGNPDGAAASLDAMARGARPPDPEVVRGARGGVPVTHRVMLVLPAHVAPPPYWSPQATPRARLAPALDRWVGDLLGDPRKVLCRATFRADDATQERVLSLADLGLRPLDFVSLARERPPAFERGRAEEVSALGSELERRLALCLPPGATKIRFDFWSESLREGGVSFPEACEVARAIEDLIGGARALRGGDLALPEHAPTVNAPAVTDDALAAVRGAVADLKLACKAILVAGGDDELRGALLGATLFDLPGAMPETPEESGEALRARGRRTVDEITRRLYRAAWPPNGGRSVPAGLDAETLRGLAVAQAQERPGTEFHEVVEAVFGRRRIVLPDFPAPAFRAPVRPNTTTRSPSAEELRRPTRLTPSESSTVAERRAWDREVSTWMQKMWRVREPLTRWRRVSLYERALRAAGSRVDVAQLEPRAYGRWAALPEAFDRGTRLYLQPPPGCVSLYMLRPLDGAGPWTGLLLDEWTEFIPNARELTGIAFHYDDPGAEAAQAVLLAVPPVEGVRWTKEALFDVLDETYELAQVRALDLEHFDELAQVAPGVCLASNAERDTVSTSFSGRLAADPIGPEVLP